MSIIKSAVCKRSMDPFFGSMTSSLTVLLLMGAVSLADDDAMLETIFLLSGFLFRHHNIIISIVHRVHQNSRPNTSSVFGSSPLDGRENETRENLMPTQTSVARCLHHIHPHPAKKEGRDTSLTEAYRHARKTKNQV